VEIIEKIIPYNWSDIFHFYPLGDVHMGSIDSAEDDFNSKVIECVNRENSFALGMGDYADCITKNDPRFDMDGLAPWVKKGNIIESQRKRVVQLFKPLAESGKLIALGTGNHEEEIHLRYQDDITRNICEDLNVPYAGYSCFVILTFRRNNSNESHQYIWHSWHGAGAAQTEGARLMRLMRLVNDIQAHIYCVDEKTEILTSEGWRSYNSIKETDIPVTFNLTTNEIQKDKLLGISRFKSEGWAYRIVTNGMEQMLHPKHRIIYRYRNNPNWFIQAAETLAEYRSQICLPMAGHTKSPHVLTDDNIKLAAWLISEGCFRKYPNKGINISQQAGEKAGEIRNILERGHFKFSEYRSLDCINFYIWETDSKVLREFLVSGKHIPKWVSVLDDRQFKLFVDTYMQGDGHSNTTNNSGQIYSSDETLIDQLQIACLSHGYRTHKYFKSGGFKDGGWVLTLCNKDTVEIALARNPILQIPYDGTFWGITTGNTTNICRRDGYVFITGNTMGHLHAMTSHTPDRLMCVRGRVKSIKLAATITGSWLKAYTQPKGEQILNASYAEKKGYKPSRIGCPIINICPERDELTIES